MSLIWAPVLLWVWLVPVLLGQPFQRLCLLAEHGDCPLVANMFENTRTTFINRLVRFLAWNRPYHVEHHVGPAMPFHRLPDLHGPMQADDGAGLCGLHPGVSRAVAGSLKGAACAASLLGRLRGLGPAGLRGAICLGQPGR